MENWWKLTLGAKAKSDHFAPALFGHFNAEIWGFNGLIVLFTCCRSCVQIFIEKCWVLVDQKNLFPKAGNLETVAVVTRPVFVFRP